MKWIHNAAFWIMSAALVLGFFAPGLPAAWASSKELVVIVNKANAIGSISKSELSSIFLGKRRMWVSGETIKPCDLQESAQEEQSAMAHFTTKYMNKDMATLKNYWIKMIFSGKGEPPPVYKKPEEVIHFVSENPGAIGYVYSDQVTGAVRVVPIGE